MAGKGKDPHIAEFEEAELLQKRKEATRSSFKSTNQAEDPLLEQEPEMSLEYKRKVLKYQALAFLLSYFSYASVHIYREFWSVAKPVIEDDPNKYHVGEQTLSNVDFTNFMIYGVTQFVNGVLADKLNLKILLPVVYVIQAVIYALIAMTGFIGGEHSGLQFYVWFSILGFVQSICFPAFIHIVANWFSQKRRGFAMAAFCSCVNVGDIIGAQLGQGLLSAFEDKWAWLFVLLVVLYLSLALCIYFLLVQHPAHIGLVIERQECGQKVERKVESEQLVSRETPADIAWSYETTRAEQQRHREESLENRASVLGQAAIQRDIRNETRIGFWQAWLLPKVLFYALAYFCAKMALQVVFFSLFEFLDKNFDFTNQQQANISTMNDVGGLIGSFTVGYLSDLTYSKRSPLTFMFLVLSCLLWYILFATYDSLDYAKLMVSFLFYGFFMQGVTNTIAATCSADIGKAIPDKNTKAVSTVTGIIDGSGSVGAAIGQFIVGWTKTEWGWRYGYILLVAVMQTITLIPLGKIFYDEMLQIRQIRSAKKEQK